MSSLRFPVYLLLWVIPPVCLAQTAYLHSSEIIEGDIATLVVEYQNNVPSLFHLDTSPLEKSFKVLELKSSVKNERLSNRIINTMRWEVQISPKITGVIKIPSLNIKGDSTPELSLKVIDQASIKDKGEQIFITVLATPENPFIGEQVTITVRLIHNMFVANGQISEPKIEQANIYRIDRDRHYQETIDGETFGIIERKLAIFADSPGSLVYPAVEFRGEIENDGISRADDPPFKRRIHRESLPVILNIQPRVPGYTGKYWLPAAEMKVSQQWYGLDRDLTTGDSVRRSLTIQAVGLAATALPDDLFNLVSAGITVYADKANRENGQVKDRLSGRLEQSHAIVITGKGSIKIPDLILNWWDIDEDIQKQVILPGKTIEVSLPTIKNDINYPAFTGKGTADSVQLVRLKRWLATNWHWTLTIVIGGLILVRYWYAAGTRLKPGPGFGKHFNRSRFKRACFSGDASTARIQLIAWAQSQWPGESIAGINLIKSKIDRVDFNQQLSNLDAALYGHNQEPWQGQKLWYTFVKAGTRNLKPSTVIPKILPALYPPGVKSTCN